MRMGLMGWTCWSRFVVIGGVEACDRRFGTRTIGGVSSGGNGVSTATGRLNVTVRALSG